MAKKLYNDTMVRSQRGAFTSAKLDSGETFDDLSERLQNALPEELQVYAYGISGDYDHLVASLSRIQRTLGKKDKLEVTCRARRAEQVNEILDRASVHNDDDLSMEEACSAARTNVVLQIFMSTITVV
jgi:hypothetical protein